MSPATKPAKSRKKTVECLAEVSVEQAQITVARLIMGYDDKSGSGYPPARRNLAGCVLAQKGKNRLVSI